MEQTLYNVPLSYAVDDFGNIVTLQSWNSIIARMDFILSGEWQ
jgi:hypothetical protein